MSPPPQTQGDSRNEAEELDFRAVPNNTHKWWFADPCLRLNVIHCMGLCFCMFFNGYDGSLINGLQSLESWRSYFDNPDANTLGLINSAGYLPGIVSSFFADWMQLYLGKRWTLWINTVITVVGIVVLTTATDVNIFIGGRAILGFGTQAALAVAPAHLQEIAHPRYRATVGALFTCTYYTAAIISSAVCLGALDSSDPEAWRIPCWVQLFGPAMTFILTCTMPESPRWLVKKGQKAKARDILTKYHANGHEDDELVKYEFREICAVIDNENNLPQTRYVDFLKTPGNRWRLMILVVVAFSLNFVGNGIISYYLSPILTSLGIGDTRTQLQILIGMHVWNLIISCTASVYIDTLGRRPLWLTATAGMMVTIAAVMGLSAGYDKTGNLAFGTAVIPFLFLFYGSYDIAYSPMSYSYAIENVTFSMRTKGSAIYVTTTAISSSLNTWVNPVALDALSWKYYGVYVAINAALLVLQYFGYPETKNLTIEQIATIFDGKDAITRAHAAQGELGAESESPEVHSIREEPELKD